MPVYSLDRRLIFPPPGHAEPDGLLAVGGDLSVSRLLLAYRSGIFPWPVEGLPLVWFSPDPRGVLLLKRLHVPRRLERTVRGGRYKVTYDRDFRAVIDACAKGPNRRGGGTWITPEVARAYTAMHRAGHAHSVEVWNDDVLAGGLYGVAVGRVFFGESMVSMQRDASKVALVTLCRDLREAGFGFLDCQFLTEHLEQFGAEEIPRSRFLTLLREHVSREPDRVPWRDGGE